MSHPLLFNYNFELSFLLISTISLTNCRWLRHTISIFIPLQSQCKVSIRPAYSKKRLTNFWHILSIWQTTLSTTILLVARDSTASSLPSPGVYTFIRKPHHNLLHFTIQRLICSLSFKSFREFSTSIMVISCFHVEFITSRSSTDGLQMFKVYIM